MKFLYLTLLAAHSSFALTCSTYEASFELLAPETNLYNHEVSMDINAHGKAAIIFADAEKENNVLKVSLNGAEGWSNPVEITVTSERIYRLQCKIDDEGNVYAFWTEKGDLWGTKTIAGFWEPPQMLIEALYQNPFDVDCKGSVVALMTSKSFLDSISLELLEVAIGTAELKRQMLGPISSNFVNGNISKDPFGNRIIVWGDKDENGYSLHIELLENGVLFPVNIDPESIDNLSEAYHLAVAIDSKRNLLVAGVAQMIDSKVWGDWFWTFHASIDDEESYTASATSEGNLIKNLSIAGNQKDDFLIVWESVGEIYAAPRVYYSPPFNFVKISNEHSHNMRSNTGYLIQANPSGDFVVVWKYMGVDKIFNGSNARSVEEISIYGAVFNSENFEWSRAERLSTIEKQSVPKAFIIGRNGKSLLAWSESDLEAEKVYLRVGNLKL